MVGRTAVLQSLVELTLVGREALGHFHLQADVKITATTSAELRQTLAAEAQHGPGLGSGRHRQGRRSIERRHVEGRAEDGVWHGDSLHAPEIRAITLEPRVRRTPDDDEEVAGRSAGLPAWQALAGHAENHPVLHPKRDLHGQRLLVRDLPPSATLRTRFVDQATLAVTGGACRDLSDGDIAAALRLDLLT
jgi:hypothetical protein